MTEKSTLLLLFILGSFGLSTGCTEGFTAADTGAATLGSSGTTAANPAPNPASSPLQASGQGTSATPSDSSNPTVPSNSSTTSSTLIVTSPTDGATVSGIVQLKGQVGSEWINLASFSSTQTKISMDGRPQNGQFTLTIDTNQLPNGKNTITISGFSVGAGMSGGTSKNITLKLNVQNSTQNSPTSSAAPGTSSGGVSGAGAPPAAGGAGYNTLTFGSKITIGNGWSVVSSLASVTQNADGGITIVKPQNSWDANADVQSAVSQGDGNFSGTAFGGGGYFEATLSFQNPANSAGGWPAWWTNDIEAQSNFSSVQWPGMPNGYGDWLEPDIMEHFNPGSYGYTIHNWYGYLSSPQDVNPGFNGYTFPTGVDPSQPHQYAMLWVPATPSQRGQLTFYFDRQPTGSTSWDYWDPTHPPKGPPQNGTTAYSILDQRHLYLILGTGPNNPMTINSVEVWQTSAAKNWVH